MDLDDPRWAIIGTVFGIIALIATCIISIIALPPDLRYLGFIISIVAIMSVVVTYLRLRKFKQLTYHIVSKTLILSIDVQEEIKNRVQVLLDNRPVGNVHLVLLNIWNLGNTPISVVDYEELHIIIDFGMFAEILSAEMIKKSAQKISASFMINAGKVLIDPVELTGKKMVTLKILLTRFTEEINVYASLKGAKPLINWDKTAYVVIRNTGIIYYAYLFLSFIVSFIVLLAVITFLTQLFGWVIENGIIAFVSFIAALLCIIVANFVIKNFKPEILPNSSKH